MNNIVRGVFATGDAGHTTPLETGSGGGNDGGMEARVAKLEAAVDYIQRDMAQVRSSVGAMQGDFSKAREDIATAKERLSHMPTTLAMWGAVAAVLIPAGGGLIWVVQQYLGPILGKAAGG